MLDTLKMKERLLHGGFTDQQADALVSVITELAEVFVTKEYLRAEMVELEQRLDEKRRASERRVIGVVLAGVALMLTLFSFVQATI